MPRSLLFALIFIMGAGMAARSAEKNDPDAVSLAGVVTQPSGLPAAKAEVWLVTASMRGEPLVYDHVQADAEGKFRLILPGRWINNGATVRQELGIVAHQPGLAPAAICYWRTSTPNAANLRLELKPPSEAPVTIRAPDGRAVLGAKVSVTALICDVLRTDLTASQLTAEMQVALKYTPNGPALGRTAILLPGDLSRRLQAETDSGQATIVGVALDDAAQLSIGTEEFGTQIAQLQVAVNDYQSAAKMPETITLKPVGRVAGRLTAAMASDARGAKVRMTSTPDGEPFAVGKVNIVGRAETAADEDGRFKVPALAVGTLNSVVTLPKGSPLRPRLPANAPEVKEAEVTKLEIALIPGIRVAGLVRERSSKQPLAGISIHVYGEAGDPVEIITDQEGRYSCLLPPGKAMMVLLAPSAYAPLKRDALREFLVDVSAGADNLELPPIELVRAPTIVGAVVGEDGKPVHGATVHALGQGVRRAGPMAQRVVELTSDDGSFRIAVADPDHQVLLEARTDDAFGRIRVAPKTLDGQAVTLRILAANLIALSGSVVDTRGKPAADVPVELWVMPEGFGGMFERVKFDGNIELRTDAEGRFTAPRELDRESVYQARIALPGGEPAATAAFSASFANSTELPDLIVRRQTTLAGRVEDQQGRPVSEALIFQAGDAWGRVQATTDAQGQFRLPEVMADPMFIFVRKAGFRFFGQQIETDEESLVLTITRTDEPVEPLTTLPPALPRAERLALARRLLEPCLGKIDLNNEREGPRVFETWAVVDPADMLKRLDETPPKSSFLAGYLRRAVALALAADDADEALAVIETIADAGFRSMSYLDVVDALPDDQRQRQLDLLGQASVAARQIGEPEMRVIHLGQTAERFLNLGERGDAEKLLREGQKLAEQLPVEAFGGYARGAFAEELGQIDLPAALALMKGLTDVGEFDRHHGNLAHELAASQPAEAERLLSLLHTAKETSRIADPSALWGVRVCYRMARVDLPRARTIADRMSDSYLQAQAYGVMAQAIVQQKPQVATDLIAAAFDVLQQLVDARESRAPGKAGRPATHDSFNGLYSAASLAGALLPAVEALDPTLVREYLWRAVSFRMPRVGDETQRQLADPANAALAMMLARYDRPTSAAIMRPIETRLLGFHSRDAALGALALIAPQRAVETLERRDPDQADLLTRAQLASLLTLEGDALWRKLLASAALWSIDVEDI